MTSRQRHATITSSVDEYRVSFHMDDVETVRDLPLYFPDVDSLFQVHPDPVFDKFRGGKKIYKGEALILTVSSQAISSVSSQADVSLKCFMVSQDFWCLSEVLQYTAEIGTFGINSQYVRRALLKSCSRPFYLKICNKIN